MTDFAKEIHRITTVYNKRLRAVSKLAVQATVKDAQTVRPAGRMRVDTGFLRGSIASAIGQMPYGQSKNPGNAVFDSSGDGTAGIAATLLRWNPEKGETLFVGWTANYARPREYKDGFLRGATEKWGKFVDEAAIEAKAKIK